MKEIVEKLMEIIPILNFSNFYEYFGDLVPEHKFEESLNEKFPDLKWEYCDLLEAFEQLIKDGVIETYKCYRFIV